MLRLVADVVLRCSSCGASVLRSHGRARALERAGEQLRCRDCRYPAARVEPTDEMRAYWLERFAADELVVLGSALEP